MTHLDKLRKLAEKWGRIDVSYILTDRCWTVAENNFSSSKRPYIGDTPEQAIDKAWEAEGME